MARLGRAQPFPPKLPKKLPAGSPCGIGLLESESGSSGTYVTTLTAGTNVVMCWVQTAADISVPSLSDDLGNTWTSLVSTNVSFKSAIFHTTVATGGTATITCSIGGAATSWKWQAAVICPWPEGGPYTLRRSSVTGTNEDASTTSHFCATASGFNINPLSTIIGCASTGSASGGFAPTAGTVNYGKWNDDTAAYMASGWSAGSITDERVPFSTGNSVNCKGCCVSFYSTLNDELQWAGTVVQVPDEYLRDAGRTRVIAY